MLPISFLAIQDLMQRSLIGSRITDPVVPERRPTAAGGRRGA